MSWIKYILIFIMIYVVCSARTCNEDEDVAARREEQNIMNLKDSVVFIFMSDSLNDLLLRAFEVSAAGKLNDFADYLKIISDTTIDLNFRQHAADLVKELFVTDKIKFHYQGRARPESGFNTLELLLSQSISGRSSYLINPIQISVSRQFEWENDSTYTGNLSFINRCVPFNDIDKTKTESRKLMIDIYLIKKNRSFGKDQIKVWEVYLGDIR